MPFTSRRQMKWMFAAEKRGEVPQGTALRWAHHTPDIKSLPEKKAEGGYVHGGGTGESDSIPAKIKRGSFIVPAENALMAETLRSKYIGEKTGRANINQKKGKPLMLSNGEHIFNPMESREMNDKMKMMGSYNGIDALAPKAKKKFNINKFLQ